jgi:hypothetical protein
MDDYKVLVAAEASTDALGGIAELPVKPSRIASQIRDISEQLDSAFLDTRGLPLKSIAVAVTIGADGELKFLGSGVKASAEGSITLTFERP